MTEGPIQTAAPFAQGRAAMTNVTVRYCAF